MKRVDREWLNRIERAKVWALEAGKVALEAWQSRAYSVREKEGGYGPVSDIDRQLDQYLVEAIEEAYPYDGILSEEGGVHRGQGPYLWFIDPIDGTKEYIRGDRDFCIMIGMTDRGCAKLGVIYAPARHILAWGIVGLGAWIEEEGQSSEIHVSRRERHQSRALVSKSHPDQELNALWKSLGVQTLPLGSFGIKGLEIARGRGEYYLNRSGYTALWDSAAPEALVRAAGGYVSTLKGASLEYQEIQAPYHKEGILISHGKDHEYILKHLDAPAMQRR